MLPIPTTLEKIQSCWQIPYIAHFCTLFNKYLDLPSFDTEDLELSLLKDPLKENLVPELITRLLRRCHETNRVQDSIGTNTFEPFLELFIRKTCEHDKRPNPYHVAAAELNRNVAEEGPLSFDELPVQVKAEVIQLLCEARFVATDAQTLIDQANPDSLRVLPLGYDSAASAYYYFFGTRLYKESNRFATKSTTTAAAVKPPSTPTAVPQTNGHATSDTPKDVKNESLLNGSLLNGNVSAILEDSVRYLAATESETVRWELVCQTETDWAELTKKLAKSKKTKAECALVKILEQNFLPNLTNLFRTKEKNERFQINKYIPVRASSRVKVLAEQKQRDELKLEHEKYRAKSLKRNIPFEKQFQWSTGSEEGIIAWRDKRRRLSTPDPHADAENKRSTRRQQRTGPEVNARDERAKNREHRLPSSETQRQINESEAEDAEEEVDSDC